MGRTNLDTAAYLGMRQWFALDQQIRDARNSGLYVCSGGAIVPSATAGKLKVVGATVDFVSTTELNVAAIDPINFLTALPGGAADASNPMFALIELDASGVFQVNTGTAAATPIPPALTAARVPHALIYVPANATAVDALLTTANGNAKIIDCRELIVVHAARLFGSDTTQTSLTNPTALTSLLNAVIPAPANSLNVGDLFEVVASGRYLNSQNASTLNLKLLLGTTSIFNFTSISLASNANPRNWLLRAVFQVKAIGSGSSAIVAIATEMRISTPTAGGIGGVIGGATPGDDAIGGSIAPTFDSTIGNNIDLQAAIGISSSTSAVALRLFTITKIPA